MDSEFKASPCQITRIVVLCPMRMERVHVERALKRAGLSRVRVVQTGIGKDAVVRAVDAAVGGAHRPDLIILAGSAGGLRNCDPCPPIARVVDEGDGEWKPFDPDRGGRDAITLIGVDRIVSNPQDKAAVAAATGASIVDMESHAFAAHCQRLGVRWSVVRCVSDSPEETLPGEVLGWITPEGDERIGRAIWDMVRKPSLIPHVLAVKGRADRVLPLAGRRVVRIIHAWESNRPPGTVALAEATA